MSGTFTPSLQDTANLLTVRQTCRRQGLSVIEFFEQAIKAMVNPKRMFEKWYSVIFITLLPPFPLVKGGNNKNPVPSP